MKFLVKFRKFPKLFHEPILTVQPTPALSLPSSTFHSVIYRILKPFTSDWDLNPCAGTRTQPKPSLGLKPMWLGFEPSQNPAWDLNPPGWDSNPAKTHGTWFQDLMKLRFLMSYHRKNSVRDKVVGKKWIYSDSERSTFHRQSVGHPRGQVGLRNVTWFVLMGWVQFIWPLHLLMGARAP